MKNITIRCPDGTRWRVREALSLRAALNEIAHARVMGSVGSSTTIDDTRIGGGIRVVADVHRIRPDGSPVQPS